MHLRLQVILEMQLHCDSLQLKTCDGGAPWVFGDKGSPGQIKLNLGSVAGGAREFLARLLSKAALIPPRLTRLRCRPQPNDISLAIARQGQRSELKAVYVFTESVTDDYSMIFDHNQEQFLASQF